MSDKEECDLCKKLVADNDEGLLCDNCLIWKHRLCISMAKKTYERIGKSQGKWISDKCKHSAKKQPSTAKNYTLADVMEKLEDMDKKYNILFEKYREQTKINEDLKHELEKIKCQLNKTEQKELNNNIIIHGIPYEKNENLNEIIKKMGNELQVNVINSQFTAVRLGRVELKRNPIKVSFVSEEIRNSLIKSKRRLHLNTQQLGFPASDGVFLNHDLTKHNLQLFKLAQTFRHENGYKYLWINKGNILLRKEDNSKIILVEKEQDLKN